MDSMQKSSVDVKLWQVRATAWELLALSFRYPTAELAQALISGEWELAAVEISDELGFKLPEEYTRELDTYGKSDPAEVLRALRSEATRMFIGSPVPAVSPYEGVCRAQVEDVQALMFVNPHAMEVEKFMKSCGLGQPEGTNEPLDHVATECELLSYLAQLSSGAKAPPNAPTYSDLPGGDAQAAYNVFLENHGSKWMPKFAEEVGAQTHEPLYRATASMLQVLVA